MWLKEKAVLSAGWTFSGFTEDKIRSPLSCSLWLFALVPFCGYLWLLSCISLICLTDPTDLTCAYCFLLTSLSHYCCPFNPSQVRHRTVHSGSASEGDFFMFKGELLSPYSHQVLLKVNCWVSLCKEPWDDFVLWFGTISVKLKWSECPGSRHPFHF